MPGLHLAAAHDPVAGIEADLGIGRAEAAGVVAVVVVQTGHVVVEQRGKPAGLIAGNVLGDRAQRLGRYHQVQVQVGRVMLNHGLRVLLEKVVATAFLGRARRRRHQLRGVQQRRVEAGCAVLIDAHIDAPAPLAVDRQVERVAALGKPRGLHQQAREFRVDAALEQGLWVKGIARRRRLCPGQVCRQPQAECQHKQGEVR
ncbi:hypothetical protein PS708_05183 [Pseudomonas fluorescens]|nr:hypothetical protein PS708_05183 [Pseudomonas fluorescens]